MKKIKKINLQIDKEVISSLSNDEMNSVKGGDGIFTIEATCNCVNPGSPIYSLDCYGGGGGGGTDSVGDCTGVVERGSKVGPTGVKPITCDCPISPDDTYNCATENDPASNCPCAITQTEDKFICG